MAGKNRELKDENKKLVDENKELRKRMDSLEEKIINLKGEIVKETITEVMRRLKEDESKKQDEIINRAKSCAVKSNDIKKHVNEYISNARDSMGGVEWGCVGPFPGRKKYSLLRDKYFREDSRIHYFCSKSLNMHSE